MTRVLLIHCRKIAHYRIPIYGYLSKYLNRYNFELSVTSDGIQDDNPHSIDFKYFQMPLTVLSIARLILKERIDTIIMFVDMRHLYLFPTYLIAKYIYRKKMIYWGQGCDLLDPQATIKNLAYATEQSMCDSIILYAEHLKKYVPPRFHKKVFIANNTLCLDYPGIPQGKKETVLKSYGIHTRKNIICMGRMQKRKRLDQLVKALTLIKRPDTGLILVGPDTEGILDKIDGDNIYKLGPVYGEKKFDLLSSADVYCLPGAVGLSIIDAFHCGLPFVTEAGDESAEIMYLRDGVNGFIVPRGDVEALAQKLKLLLNNDTLRQQFSDAAKKEITENGNIDKMAAGFRDALCYVTGQTVCVHD